MEATISRFKSAFSRLPEGVQQAELHCERIAETTVTWDGAQVAAALSFDKTALHLRIAGDKAGNMYTEDLGCDPDELIRQLLDSPASGGAKRVPMNGQATQRAGEEVPPLPGGELAARARELHRAASVYSNKIVCTLTRHARESVVINSLGLDTRLRNTLYLAGVDFDMPDGGKVRFLESFSRPDIREISARLAVEVAIVSGGMPSLPLAAFASGRYDAVMSSLMLCQLLTTGWQSFSGDKIGSGASSIRQVGETVGSSAISIVNTPASPLTGFNFAIDCEGTPCIVRDIVRDGVLVSPLLDLMRARTFGLPPTGSAGRADTIRGSIPNRILPVPSHFYIKPGSDSVDSLLGRMGDGIYLTYSLDAFHAINIASGMFSVPCGGVQYKGGKPVARVEQITMAGSLKELLGAAEACGNDLRLQHFMYNNYCFGGPSLLLRGMAFAG
jgi:PmbA protein